MKYFPQFAIPCVSSDDDSCLFVFRCQLVVYDVLRNVLRSVEVRDTFSVWLSQRLHLDGHASVVRIVSYGFLCLFCLYLSCCFTASEHVFAVSLFSGWVDQCVCSKDNIVFFLHFFGRRCSSVSYSNAYDLVAGFSRVLSMLRVRRVGRSVGLSAVCGMNSCVARVVALVSCQCRTSVLCCGQRCFTVVVCVHLISFAWRFHDHCCAASLCSLFNLCISVCADIGLAWV